MESWGRVILLTIFLLLWYQQYNSSLMKTVKTEAKHTHKKKVLPKFVWIATGISFCMQLPCPSFCLVSSGLYWNDGGRSRGNTTTRMCGMRNPHLIGGRSGVAKVWLASNRQRSWGFCIACGIIHMTLQHHSPSVDVDASALLWLSCL